MSTRRYKMDVRATPYPIDLEVISKPVNFIGWVISLDLEDCVYTELILRTDSPHVIANKLHMLAARIETCSQ
jgi:hypothetical protein